MTATNLNQQIEGLRAVLDRFPDGASLEQIGAAAGLAISRRTLIRRLARMVELGLCRKSGNSRAARYFPADAAPSAEPAVAEMGFFAPRDFFKQPDMFAPLSECGAVVLRLISQPLVARRPVAYNRAFLDAYHPNETSYLTPTERRRLRAISKTTESDHQPAGTYAQRILNRLLIDLSWNSSRLEGNTYSLLDTQLLIEAGVAAEGKAPIDAQMILNHKAAIEFLVQSAGEIGFDRHTILNLHSLLAENLLPDPNACGRVRSVPVSIGHSVYLPPEIPHVLKECFDQILATAAAIRDPFEQAFFAMVHLPYLQPFEDVNKRVSRLAANIPLIRANLSPLSFVDTPDDLYTQGVLA